MLEGEVVNSIQGSCFPLLLCMQGQGEGAIEREFLHASIIDSPPFIMLAKPITESSSRALASVLYRPHASYFYTAV